MSLSARRLGAVLLAAATVTGGAVAPALADDSALGDPDGAVDVQVPAPAAIGALIGKTGTDSLRPAGLPVPAGALPAALDVKPVYVEQDSCDPYAKPGTKALGNLLRSTFQQGGYGIERKCDQGAASEHKEGRALDWMLSVHNAAEKAAGDAAVAWLTAGNGVVARRIGVQYIIWNRRMWRAYAPERGFTFYTGRNPHTDHVHISLTWDGAMKRTSWWSGQAVGVLDRGPCRVYAGQYAPVYTVKQTRACSGSLPKAPASPYPVYVVGDSSSTIAVAQRVLGVKADGAFGSGTRTALMRYQATRGLPRTGVLDNASWVSLTGGSAPTPAPQPAPPQPNPPAPGPGVTKQIPQRASTRFTAYKKTVLSQGSRGPAVKMLQFGLGTTQDGVFGSGTRSAVMRLQSAAGLDATGVVDIPTWTAAERHAYPWLAYVHSTQRVGSRGPAVVALQSAFGITANGIFGSQTKASVTGLQRTYGLKADGVVGPLTWRALIAEYSH